MSTILLYFFPPYTQFGEDWKAYKNHFNLKNLGICKARGVKIERPLYFATRIYGMFYPVNYLFDVEKCSLYNIACSIITFA
jgi:hypothetical protein